MTLVGGKSRPEVFIAKAMVLAIAAIVGAILQGAKSRSVSSLHRPCLERPEVRCTTDASDPYCPVLICSRTFRSSSIAEPWQLPPMRWFGERAAEHCEPEAFSDALGRRFHENGGCGLEHILCREMKVVEPARKIALLDTGQFHMGRHRSALVDAGVQQHRRPEALHGRQVHWPVGDVRPEDGAEPVVGPNG